MHKLRKSALLTSSRYLPNIGGIENSLHNLSIALSRAGWVVDIVASNVVESGKKDLPHLDYVESNVRVLRYSYYIFGRPSALRSYFSGYLTYRRLRKAQPYELVVCRNHVTVILCRLA